MGSHEARRVKQLSLPRLTLLNNPPASECYFKVDSSGGKKRKGKLSQDPRLSLHPPSGAKKREKDRKGTRAPGPSRCGGQE